MDENKNVRKDIKKEQSTDLELLNYLKQNENKLKILLSGDQNIKPLIYPIKGKRATKTVFIAENLQTLMTEFCTEREMKIGDFTECAIIQYLVQNGYADRLKSILNTSVEVIHTNSNI